MIPPQDIRFGWRDHVDALRWLALGYRRPRELNQAVAELDWRGRLRTGMILCAHASVWVLLLPYLILAALVYVIAREPGELEAGLLHAAGPMTWVLAIVLSARSISAGTGVSIWGPVSAWGMFLPKAITSAWIATQTLSGVAVIFAGEITFRTDVWLTNHAQAVVAGLVSGIAAGLTITSVTGPPEVRWLLPLTSGWIALAYYGGGGSFFLMWFGPTVAAALTRAYYVPFATFLVWPRLRPDRYLWHPVAWDSMCTVPFWRLDRLLIALAESDPEFGRTEIRRLIETYPAQRDPALRASTVLSARRAALSNLSSIDAAIADLPEGSEGFLAETHIVRKRVAEIADIQRKLDTLQRPVLREPLADLLVTKIQNFIHQSGGLEEPLRTEFRRAAQSWQAAAQRQLEETRTAGEREPVTQLFRAGDPIDRQTEAFIARDDVTSELEQQVLLATGCPGVILYGRRRRGKSTILTNLAGFLPPHVKPAYLSMQRPEAFTSVADFCRQIGLLTGDGSAYDLPSLFRALEARNRELAAAGERLMLCIDEYEQLDRKIGDGALPLDLLHAIRESIQTHRSITWIFAGSAHIEELGNAPWTSCLISARTIEVPCFTPAETRLLLTDPVRHSALWPRDSPDRPRFAESFWGPEGIERIHRETYGWPALVQLVAETCVDLVNLSESAREVSPAMLEKALDKAAVRGEAVFFELMKRESSDPEWEYLEGFRDSETQPPPPREIARSLRRRDIVAVEDGRWRLAAPLMRRWLMRRW